MSRRETRKMKTLRETIVIGSDHAGYEMKEFVKEELAKRKFDVRDVGAHTDTEPSDYPVFVAKVAAAVSTGHFSRGIAIDGAGMGSSIVANRFPHVRATLCNDVGVAKLARAHADSNILVLAGRLTPSWLAAQILETWLDTSFEGGRHARRVRLMDDNMQLSVALSHLAEVNHRRIQAEAVNQPFVDRAMKGLEKIAAMLVSDRRRTEGTSRAVENCPSRLNSDGRRYKALMMDLSERGAQFRVQEDGDLAELMVDDPIECSVKTAYGTAKCTGVVKWVDLQSGTIGVVFSDMEKDEAEPLRTLLDSNL